MRETFLRSGQLGQDLLAVDWDETAVGPPEEWPALLRTTVRTMLHSRFPMWMAWGPSLTFFCNDAYRRVTLGAKYPWALGKPAPVVWSEIWDDIGPRVEVVLREGVSTWDEKLLLFLERSGFREETYHTFSYSPIVDDDEAVAGMLCVVSEDTEEVIANRRIRALGDLANELAAQLTEAETVSAAARGLSAMPLDLPFHLGYLYDEQGAARLAWTGDPPADHAAAPQVVRPDDDGALWVPAPPGEPVALVPLPDERFAPVPTGGWDVPPTQAAVVPIQGPQGAPYGFLVVGLNPLRPFDPDYADFLELVSGQLAAALTDARAFDLERQRAESLAALDRAKTDFFTNVSHEFRTPLTLLLGPADDALADVEDPLPPRQRDRVAMVQRNGLRLLKLVNTLLDFSRLESGRVPGSFEPVDVATYTRQLASMFAAAAERLGLQLEVDCPPLDQDVYLDRELWAKVVLNLVSNALKFTFEGTIRVQVEDDGDGVALSVRDSGTGIPAEEQAELFKRFHRVRGVHGRSHEGSGIGLALVAEVAGIHGGRVEVDSAPGRGSTFTVRIPYGKDHLPADRVLAQPAERGVQHLADGFLAEVAQLVPGERPQAAVPATPDPGVRRPRVLVVDDNADIRQYAGDILGVHYDVETAVDGRAALEAAHAAPPDLIVTDVMMPRLDGFELLAALRADPATVAIPVVMLSARGGDEATVEGLEAGADDYLVKPFTARELLARTRANLELDRTRRTRTELQRSQEMLDEAERLAHMGSWSVELQTGRIQVSGELLRILGRTRQEVDEAGHPGFLVDLVAPSDRPFVATVLGDARPGDQIAFEMPMQRADGSPFHGSVRGEATTTGDHGPVLRCSLQDVTERHRAAETAMVARTAAVVAAREREIADELQSSLLPESTFDLKHLDVATYYRAGAEGTRVGGDWYDVIDLPEGRTGLVLGDVMGHGVRAAAVMGQVRTAVRAYGLLGLPPVPLMESLDSLVWDLFPDQIVTCVYAVFDPENLAVDIVNAGHVPPVVVGEDGVARPLEVEAHPPLGVGHRFTAAHRVTLDPGAALLLYTDGLVERRGSDVEQGIRKLVELVSGLDAPLPDLPGALVDGMLTGTPQDDVAVLVARTRRGARGEG